LNLEGHGPEWEHSEKPALEQFIKLGWLYQSQSVLNKTRDDFHEPLLLDRLENSIRKLNSWIDDYGVEDAIMQFRKFDTNVPIEANEIAYARIVGLSTRTLQPITVVQDLGEGSKPYTVKLMDFDNINNNDFLVTNQFEMWGRKSEIYPDIVPFVNGIPISYLENKSPFISNPIHEAYSDNITRYQEPNSGYEKFLYYNQFIVAACGTQAKFAPTYAEEHRFAEWVDPYPITIEQIEKEFGRARKQEILIAGMFTKSILINLIRNFTLYRTSENKRIRIMARYQQYRGVTKTIERIASGKTPFEKSGVVWHYQGSGKSYEMVWTTIQAKRKYANLTTIVTSDRIQLDRQIFDTFTACGFPNPVQASDKDDLKDLIENNKGGTIMTTVQKFPFFKDTTPYAISNEEIIVIVDEAHRTQYGVTNADMRAALPNAIFIAYTGTPLLKKSKTRKAFGDYIDIYKISQSEADGNTLPIYYESRLTELNVEGETVDKAFARITKDVDDKTKEDAKRKYANKTAIASSPDRIKKICHDLLTIYENRIQPNGFKAFIVAPSREAAGIFQETLESLNGPPSVVIMSSMPQDKKLGLDKYELTKRDRESYEARFKLSLEDEKLAIIIVVDMLLQGFDAPNLQVIFLDQGLKEHTLLQAIGRVNRPYGPKKTHGLIVDYWGNSKNLRDAYEMYDEADIQNIVKPVSDLKHLLKLSHHKVMSHFDNVDKNDLDALILTLTPDDVREEFEYDFRKFSRYMDDVLPDPEAIKYRSDLSFLSKTRAAARTALIDENLSLRDLGEKVKKLIKESIDAVKTIQLIPPTKIDNKNFMKLVNSYRTNKTKASLIEKKARKVIDENETKNPQYYKSLRLRLQEIIEHLEVKKYEDAKQFNDLQQLLNELFEEDSKSKSLGFNYKVQFAIFCNLEQSFDFENAKKLTFEIHEALKPLKVIEWRIKESTLKEMRVAVKDILYNNKIEFDDAQTIAAEIVELMRANLD